MAQSAGRSTEGSGLMVTTWQELRAELTRPDKPFECLWQDLDGVHLAPPPEEPPLTSILWAWPQVEPGQTVNHEDLRRVRLDGETAYVAHPGPGRAQSTLAWGDLHQIDQVRGADGLAAADIRNLALAEYVEDVPSDGRTPLTFVYRP